MKKPLLKLSFVIVCVSLLASCKKDYTCKCTVNVNVPGFGASSADTTLIFEDVTKKDAKKSCDFFSTQMSTEAALLGGTGGCEL